MSAYKKTAGNDIADDANRRKKRNVRTWKKVKNNDKKSTVTQDGINLKRSNSASSVLGLSVLIDPDRLQYTVSQNNYYGAKVILNKTCVTSLIPSSTHSTTGIEVLFVLNSCEKWGNTYGHHV